MARLVARVARTAHGLVKRVDWYLGTTVLAATLLAWTVVVSLEAAFSFLGELGDIGRGQYQLQDAARFVLFSLPGRACQSFPFAALLGALLGLGTLAAQWEIDAFRLAGCSPARIARAVLQAGLLLLALVLAIGEGLAPGAARQAKQLRTAALFAGVQLQGDHGFWVRDGRRMIQVGSSDADGRLTDLVVFELDTGAKLRSQASVASAGYRQGMWHLRGVRESRFREASVEVHVRDSAVWPNLIDPRLAELLRREPQSLSLRELQQYIGYLEGNGTNAERYRLAFWQRVATPVATLAMLYLSLGFVLGRLGKTGTGQRILVGVLIGLLFKVLNDMIAHAGLVYGLPAVLSALLPSLLVLGLAAQLMRKGGVATRG